jgi:hypothetical protein
MMKQSGKLAEYPFYFLFLLPLFFVFHGYLENYPVVPAWDCLLLFLKYTGISLLLLIIFFAVIRSWRTAAIMAFIVMAFHIFFGPVHDLLKSWWPQSFIVKYVFMLPVFFISFITLIIYFRKKKPAFIQLTKYINILLLAFILIDAVQLASRMSKPVKKNTNTAFTACDSCKKPDIYLIITDDYAGTIPLREVLKFDNSAFENELRKRGFHVVDSSISNYNYTPFSMASLFSMNYLQGIQGSNRSLADRKICFAHIDRNPLIDFLDDHGYDFRNYGIFKFAGKLPRRSTTFYKTGIDLITAQTFLARVDWDIRYHTVTKLKIRSELERVSYYHLRLNEALYGYTWDEAEQPSSAPRFVYTHLEMPHYPYYFDRNGKPNSIENLADANQTNTPQYVEYLQYCNKKFLELIDHIFASSKQPPIIILMSDHGFREYPANVADRKTHFMNFNSIYFPDRNYSGFYKGISMVNQFRVVLNSQFRQRLPLLKDSTSYLVQ